MKGIVLAGWTKENNDKSLKRLSIGRVLTRLKQSKGANTRGYLSQSKSIQTQVWGRVMLPSMDDLRIFSKYGELIGNKKWRNAFLCLMLSSV